MRTFHAAHQAMARAILTCPGIIIHSPVRPGAQCLYWHEIGEYYFASDTSKPGLQYITAPQVALRATNALVGCHYFTVAAPISIMHDRVQIRTIDISDTEAVYRTI